MFHNKVVVRAGGGIYYDRGELFSYFSPGYAIGTVTGGPFGVNQQLPFVNASTCPSASLYLLRGLHSHLRRRRSVDSAPKATSRTPMAPPCIRRANQPQGFGPQQLPSQRLQHRQHGYRRPGLAQHAEWRRIINNGQPISLGVYDRANKLPYTFNYTLDSSGSRATISPSNSATWATWAATRSFRCRSTSRTSRRRPTQPSPGGAYQQNYSYGYNVNCVGLPECSLLHRNSPLPRQLRRRQRRPARSLHRLCGRVHRLQGRRHRRLQRAPGARRKAHEPRHSGWRLLHLLACPRRAERPGPLLQRQQPAQPAQRLRLGRLRPHPRAQLQLHLPASRTRPASTRWPARSSTDGRWSGLTVLQSGQPYSVIDFSGAIGSIYYSTADGITNPIVPLANGCTAKNATTGASGAWTPASGKPALDAILLHASAAARGRLERRNSHLTILTRPASPPASATSSARPSRSAPMLRWSR